MRSEIRKLPYLNQNLLSATIGKFYEINIYILESELQCIMYQLWINKEVKNFLCFWAGTKAWVLCHESWDTEITISQPIFCFCDYQKVLREQGIYPKICSTINSVLILISYGDRKISVMFGGHRCTCTELWGVIYGNYHISTNILSLRLPESPERISYTINEDFPPLISIEVKQVFPYTAFWQNHLFCCCKFLF